MSSDYREGRDRGRPRWYDDRWRDDERDVFGYEGEGYLRGGGFRPNDYGDFNRGDYAGGGVYGQASARDFDDDRATESRASYRGRGPKNYQRSDARILEDVCERLERDHDVDASEIEVSVQSGIVTLTGTVNERRQKRLAEDIADSCGGVKDVQNNIRIARP